ncbi:MAG: hypothetical protein JJV88_03350 [Sulfurovum sp.]|nr:hypothetical protein [Sulfurovaceae bacterium]
MLALNIENSEIEKFYKQECSSNKQDFVNNILEYIKIYNIEKSTKQGIKEIEEMRGGERKEQELKSFLDEL